MDSNLKIVNIICQVKDQLNKDRVKLWLQPFYEESFPGGIGPEEEQAIQVLCVSMSEQLNIPQQHCLAALKELQAHAVDRLKADHVFKETGIACLRVKVSGERPMTLTINIATSSKASDLMEDVEKGINVPSERIKLISLGKVLKPDESLVSQGVKNSSQLMAVIMGDSQQLQESEKRIVSLENTKKDVHLLAGRSNIVNEFYLQVENQHGETMQLPAEERKSLVTGMTMHEKGRAALKREDYPLALVLFLEADKEYSACNSQLLATVDNYALLHLDIAWCYLCLRNPAQIPDAEQRLSLCEKSFHKSYGENLERLMVLKGTTGNEAALFMRLHLLQGVVCFHQNRRVEAKRQFERAQSELRDLKVDDNKLCLLIELGFTNAEARLGLRATHNNIEAAEELIQRKRKEKELAREKNKILRQQEKERAKLGLCADGKQYCEPSLVKQMVEMGFNRRQSVAALKLANNRISEALTLIQETPHLLPGSSRSVSEESVAQVVSLGVPLNEARDALERCPGLEQAVRSLSELSSSSSLNAAAVAAASATAMNLVAEMQNKKTNQQEEEMQAFKRVSEDLLGSDLSEDHLDMDLAQEEQFLIEYLSLFD